MKIWVTGAKGMLGTEMLKHLTGFWSFGTDKDEVDITDRAAVTAFVRSQEVTHIINCAAYTQVDSAEEEREQAHLVNVIGVENLAHVAEQCNLHLLHFSTDYVFDGTSKTPYKETDPCHPLSVYGKTKWEGEKALHNKNACIIRTSWLIGAHGINFVETMLKLMQELEVLGVIDDQVGRPTFCRDLAEVAVKMLNQKGIYHFANSGYTSWYQFAREIYATALSLGYRLEVKALNPIKTKDYPLPAKRPYYSVLHTEKIETLLHFKPRPWQEALGEYLSQKQKDVPLCAQYAIS